MITSKDNAQVKFWHKLKLKKYRDQSGLFLVYGKHLVQTAQKHGVVETLITSNNHEEGILISDALMKSLSQTETHADVMAVCKKTNLPKVSKRILVFDDIQDPSNAGALIRSAAAFGFSHIIFSPYSVDFYHEKVIRASQGAIFDVFHQRKNLVEAISFYKDKGYQVYGADAHQSDQKPIKDKPLMLILGNEGKGISKTVHQAVDGLVHIKTQVVESLNVSVAGSILMYEWREM